MCTPLSERERRKNKNFDNPIHNFRAIAILFIVILHTVSSINSPKVTTYTEDTRKFFDFLNLTLFQSSTFFFIFISGYLSYSLFKNIEYKKFIIKKIKNVLSPYILMSIFFIFISYIKYKITGVYLWGMPEPHTFSDILRMIFYGQAQVPYWYIPFILVIFVITHPFIKYIGDNIINIILLTCLLPIFFPRFVPDISIDKWFITNFTYFSPIYFIGIGSYIYKEKILLFIHNNFSIILSIFILSTILYFFKLYILYTTGMQACLYIQKILATFIIFYILNKYNFINRLMSNIATYSFGIYFLHQFFINILSHRILNYISIKDCIILNAIAIIINILVVIFLSYFCCIVSKKIFKKYSRNITGA